MNFNKNIGMLLLAIYLILIGITQLTGLVLSSMLFGVLALITGILILIGK